jgi:hypothetical protein
MLAINSQLCSYYHFLKFKVGLDEKLARTFCECLSIMKDKKQMGVLVDIFTTGKKIFEANNAFDSSIFAKEPTQDEISHMMRYAMYTDYLKSRVPMYLSCILAVGRLIQLGGYQGAISTSFKEANMIPTKGDPIAIDIAIKNGIKIMEETMKSDIKILDQSKDHQVMVEVAHVLPENLDKDCKMNKIVVDSVGVRDLRSSLSVGNITPRDKNEMAKAQAILLSPDHKVPVCVSKFEKVDNQIQARDRQVLPLDCGKLEKLGFDYYKLASSKEKVLVNTTSAGFKDIKGWSQTDALATFKKDIDEGKFVDGKIYLLGSSWIDTKVDIKTRKFLSHCKFKYVGKSTGLWNWVVTYCDQVQIGEDEAMMLIRIIPKIYKISLLLGIRKIPWTLDSDNFLLAILNSLGMGKQVARIKEVMGHLLHEHIYKVNLKYKPQTGVSKEITDNWFGEDIEVDEAFKVELKDVKGLGGLFEGTGFDDDDDGDPNVKKSVSKSEVDVNKGAKDKEEEKQPDGVKDDYVDEYEYTKNQQVLWDVAWSETQDEEQLTLTDSVVAALSKLPWDDELLEFYFENICVLVDNDDAYKRPDVSSILMNKDKITLIFDDGANQAYSYYAHYLLSKSICRLWSKEKGYSFLVFDPPPTRNKQPTRGRGSGVINRGRKEVPPEVKNDAQIKSNDVKSDKVRLYLKPVSNVSGEKKEVVVDKNEAYDASDLMEGASNFFD